MDFILSDFKNYSNLDDSEESTVIISLDNNVIFCQFTGKLK